MISAPGLLALILDVVVIVGIVINPLRRKHDHCDKGRGNRVILPPPLQGAIGWRTGTFSFLCIVGSIALIGLRRPDLSAVYRSAVKHLVGSVITNSQVVASYTNEIRPIIPIAVIAFAVACSVTIAGSVPRRLMVLSHAAIALGAALVSDTVLTVFSIETHLPLGPFPLVSILLHYLIAYAVAMRLTLTTFQLPRATQVPMLRMKNSTDNAITFITLATAFTLIGGTAVIIISTNNHDLLLYTFVLIAMPAYLKFSIYALLSFLRLFGPKPPNPPNPTAERPLINVIGPAFNESANVESWIRAIDVAAGNYGGPVHIILTDDGSTDGTVALARAAMTGCVHATGTVLAGQHKGKATALNLALTTCTADYVVRHDTDCLVHPHAFLYTVPWLETDPRIGLVGAFMMPKMPFTTWIDRMRALELAAGFGLPRLAYSVIDSQPCVPGNYTAFRREVAIELGGFTEGMFGEDIDFTCNVARLGYRAVYDRRIWAYEDVPTNVPQLRIQRRRWNRGSIYNFARFDPLAAGSGGPRFWFAEFIKAARRLVMPLQFAAYLFAIQSALFNPGVRLNIFHLAAFLVLAKLPLLLVVICSMFYRGLRRTLPWWPLFLYFSVIKRLANLEAILTLVPRPVELPWGHPAVADNAELDWPVIRPSWLPSPQPGAS